MGGKKLTRHETILNWEPSWRISMELCWGWFLWWESSHRDVAPDSCWHFMTLLCLLWELPFIAKRWFLFYSFSVSGSKPVLEVCSTNPHETSQFKAATTSLLKFEGNTHCGLVFHLIFPSVFVLSFYLYCSVTSENIQKQLFYLQLCGVVWSDFGSVIYNQICLSCE